MAMGWLDRVWLVVFSPLIVVGALVCLATQAFLYGFRWANDL